MKTRVEQRSEIIAAFAGFATTAVIVFRLSFWTLSHVIDPLSRIVVVQLLVALGFICASLAIGNLARIIKDSWVNFKPVGD